MKEGIFRTDSSSSTARLTNSRLRSSGSMCIGKWASCTGSGNSSY
jgi:pectate lyase C